MATKKQLKKKSSLVSSPVRLPLTVVTDSKILERINRYKEDKGLRFPQDVLRLSVAYFLEKNGY